MRLHWLNNEIAGLLNLGARTLTDFIQRPVNLMIRFGWGLTYMWAMAACTAGGQHCHNKQKTDQKRRFTLITHISAHFRFESFLQS